MKRNALIEELKKKGFGEADGYLKRNFNGRDLRLFISSNMFGKITEVTMICVFENDLEDELHEEVLETAEKLVNGLTPSLRIASIGYDFLEAEVTGKAMRKSADILIRECAIFADAIAPLLGKYLL